MLQILRFEFFCLFFPNVEKMIIFVVSSADMFFYLFKCCSNAIFNTTFYQLIKFHSFHFCFKTNYRKNFYVSTNFIIVYSKNNIVGTRDSVI